MTAFKPTNNRPIFTILCSLLITVLTASGALANQCSNLPPCRLDSFVAQAGTRAEAIYGDEGFRTPPPFFGFTNEHRIASGIVGQRDAGLTTGHGSVMPCASGRDEYITPGGEWCYSGPTGGRNPYSDLQDQGYDASFRISIFEDKIIKLNGTISDLNNQIDRLVLMQKNAPASVAQALAAQLSLLLNQRQQFLVALIDVKKDMQTSFGNQGQGGAGTESDEKQ